MDEKQLVITAQIMHLCMWLQHNTNYKVTLILDGIDDIFHCSVINNNNVTLLDKDIESFSKKALNLVNKELEKIAQDLLDIKQGIETR